jgi:hypothetical protein
MSDKTVAQKLLIKPGNIVRLVNAPHGYAETLGPLPAEAKMAAKSAKPADVLQVFVKDMAELKKWLPQMKDAVAATGLLWLTYPKGTSAIRTDINRDIINTYANTVGWQVVAIFSVDDTWAAMRMKRL